MKFLCICTWGHSRSAAMTQVLHRMGHEAVCAGYHTSRSSFPVLMEWADVVLVADEYILKYTEQTDKPVYNLALGKDVWSNPYDKHLKMLVASRLEDVFDDFLQCKCGQFLPTPKAGECVECGCGAKGCGTYTNDEHMHFMIEWYD